MRGTLKNDEYFAEKLAKSDADTVRYETLLAQVIAEKGDTDKGAQWGYAILNTIYQNRINLLYTAGTRDDEIKPTFEKLLANYVGQWKPDSSYVELVKVLSLAVLLDYDREDGNLRELIRKITESVYDDYLVDRLLCFFDSNRKQSSHIFRWKHSYQPLQNVIESSDEAEAVSLLATYLKKQWYNIHKECAWFDSHKNDKTTYYGYWSFESAAVVKMCGLDDSSLKGQAYYPYDLVHL
jgi:hypothetical protein